MPAISVACFCANAPAQSSVWVTPGTASSPTMLYPEWQPALNTIEFFRLTLEAASSLAFIVVE